MMSSFYPFMEFNTPFIYQEVIQDFIFDCNTNCIFVTKFLKEATNYQVSLSHQLFNFCKQAFSVIIRTENLDRFRHQHLLIEIFK